MSDTVIKVENLSKQYQLGVIGSGTLSRDVQSWWARMRGKEDPNTKINEGKSRLDGHLNFWALKDISFDIKRGEVLGVIGSNGAGKSTLLKILSRVTGPTSGQIKIKGRVASLLEVGTGFHPELTGRENVYLNGAILGMRKNEIDRKFNEIVEFSGVSQFIDTPVKRYSSGMYVRLAFAVAAHLEPEILIIDEVLAVGDTQFQKKCLEKMEDVSKEGRTVIFVSHNMEAVSILCQRGIVLSRGSLVFEGNAVSAVNEYMSSTRKNNQVEGATFKQNNILGDAQILSVCLKNLSGRESLQYDLLEPVNIEIDFVLRRPFKNFSATCHIYSQDSRLVLFSTDMDWYNYKNCAMKDEYSYEEGNYHATVSIPAPMLNGGVYQLHINLYNPWTENLHHVDGIYFEVNDYNSFSSFPFKKQRDGLLSVPLKWEIVSKA